MRKGAIFFSLCVALALSQNLPNALSFGQQPIILTQGLNYTTGFRNSVSTVSTGSQFAVYVPHNVSRVKIHWQRSETTDTCGTFSDAWLIGKYGSWPCTSSAYDVPNDLCSHYNTLGNSAGEADTYILNAYSTNGLEYTWNSPAINDLVQGEWLYMASYVDSAQGGACTATINVDFEYCPEYTIPAEDFTNKNSKCISYSRVQESHSELAEINSYPPQKYWVVTVPANSSGIRVTVHSYDSDAYYYIYGRLFVGGEKSRYYGYASGYNTKTMWIPNPPAGDFVISVVVEDRTFLQFDFTLNVFTCPEGFTADNQGNCSYPFTAIDLASLATSPISVTVPAFDSASTADCNWRVYGFLVEPWGQGYANLTLDETGGENLSGKVMIRKNAWPTSYTYDVDASSDTTFNLTPEDFYLGKPTWLFIGFCNNDATEESTWTLSASLPSSSVPMSPSPVPSPSANPSSVPSSSPAASSPPSSSPAASVLPSSVPSASPNPLPSADPSPSSAPETSSSPAVSPSPEVDSSGLKISASVLLSLAVLIVLLSVM